MCRMAIEHQVDDVSGSAYHKHSIVLGSMIGLCFGESLPVTAQLQSS